MEEQDRSGYRQVISSAEGQGTAESSGYYSSGSSAGAEYGRGPADPYAGYYTEPAPAPQEEKKTGFWKGFFTGIGVLIAVRVALIAVAVMIVAGLLRRVSPEEFAARIRDWAAANFGPTVIIDPDSEADSFLDELKAYIDYYFVLEYDEESMETEVRKAYVEALGDPYSAYLTKEEFESMMESSNGSYCGIGVQVTQDQTTKEVTVITVFRNSSAAGADIRKDDIIVGVDGTDVRQFALDDVVALIRGEEGTYVDVTVHRPSEDRDITVHVQRARVEIDTVEYRMLDKTTGYISLSEFDDVSLGQMQEAIRELSKQGMKQLVFDLRDNPGGLLSSVINISDLFLGRNELVMYMEDKQGQEYKYYSQNAAYFTGKMAVLVNGNSASASEVFSGAMKDHGRAILVGEQTFGKGIVQSFFHLSDDSYVKLTTDHYCTPNGHDIHGTGITPDILAPDDPETLEDEGLAAALLALGAN
ncbi:MAG: S41 family peptidase [Lachnospiraceae bacterium]|nr:S41 family peptidase [Lachnospiraceae bacterium]